MRRALAAAAAAMIAGAAGAGGHPGVARAAGDMETGIADDAILLGGGAAAEKAVAAWKDLGIDAVRIHARWIAIAPGPHNTVPPEDFHPRDPDDPRYNWGALDNAVSLVHGAGMRVILSVTGSGPLWSSAKPAGRNPRYKPRATRFGDFAAAVARRYAADVDSYIIWNEPNQPGWLQPQFDCPRPRHCSPVAPHVYRELFAAASAEIRYADPGAQVLIGALAPRGESATKRNAKMRPLQFIRALGCVDSRYRRIRTGACRRAVPVRASGFSYHPHPVLRSPEQHSVHRDEAAIGDLGRLEAVLDKTQRAGILRPSGPGHFPLYLTEFGYQTRPPDPFSGVTPSQQSAWLQESWYRAWRDPRVKNVTQYEWLDEPLRSDTQGFTRYAGWQSGLRYADGRAKPVLAAFPHPFFVDVRPGRVNARFWGQVRPGAAWRVRVERRTASGWATVKSLSTNRFGYWWADLPVRARHTYAFSYEVPDAADPAVLHRVRSATLTVAPKNRAG
jgi:hypothetical protein